MIRSSLWETPLGYPSIVDNLTIFTKLNTILSGEIGYPNYHNGVFIYFSVQLEWSCIDV